MVLRHLNQSLGCRIKFRQFYRTNISISQLAEIVIGEQSQRACHAPDDLRLCVVLPRDIAYSVRTPQPGSQEHVLLTGCTGFLGSHLLAEMIHNGTAKISCIIRAKNYQTANGRVKAAMRSWGLEWEKISSHVDVFFGDVCKPFLGLRASTYARLAAKVDTVYHSAATVSFIAPFTELEKVNVTGTIEVLRFASTLTQKRVTYISTLSAFSDADKETNRG